MLASASAGCVGGLFGGVVIVIIFVCVCVCVCVYVWEYVCGLEGGAEGEWIWLMCCGWKV